MAETDEKKIINPGENPGSYLSLWEQQLEAAAEALLSRGAFSYDPGADALYGQYRDRYITQGRQAMLDTLGQSAALTGGYGNSYAQTAGQQIYQSYLQGLNDRIPQLYQLALDKYLADGDALTDRYGVLADREATDYDRYRDQVADWQFQMEFDEDKRRYDQEWEAKSRKGGGGGGSGKEEDETVVPLSAKVETPNTPNTVAAFFRTDKNMAHYLK